MAKGSENDFPSILVTEQGSAPASPASGKQRLYMKTDHKLYHRDSGGTETEVGAGAGTIGGATGSTDNAVIRADGTGGATVQSSLATVDDSGGINIPTGQTYNINGSPHTHAGGTNLVPWVGTATLTPPPAVSGFTWVNQGSSTATEANDVIRLYNPPATGTQLHLLVKAKSAPYVITMRILAACDSNYNQCGFAWRDSAGGGIITWGPNFDNSYGLRVCRWTSETAVSSYYSQLANVALPVIPLWLQIEDNNTNRICRYSTDGLEWVDYHIVGRTDFITANQIGYYVGHQTTSTTTGAMIVTSWTEA